MCNEALEFEVGEREYVGGRVRSMNPKEVVVVTDSGYEIFENETLVKDGKCEVDGSYIRFLFEAERAGTFVVKMFACVGLEKSISKRTLIVRE